MNSQLKFVFNTSEWAKIVTDTYGFKDYTVRHNKASLPLFISKSPLFGKKLVSAVFNTYASPIYSTNEELEELLTQAIEIAEREKVQYLQIKAIDKIPKDIEKKFNLICKPQMMTTIIPLMDFEEYKSNLSRNFKTNLNKIYNKIQNENVIVSISKDVNDLKAFYNLLTKLYRNKHLMVPQPYKLFKKMFDLLILNNKGHLFVAKRGDKILGALLYNINEKIATGSAIAIDDSFKAFSVDNLLKIESIKYYCEQGFKFCDFGISSPHQKDLLFQKSRWNGKTYQTATYYYLVKAKEIPEIDFSTAYLWLRRPFKYVPLPLVKELSNIIVKYLN